jgi:DMSO/TMAO reductase YedYZ molybdopterin-dependent catalytic subunit
MMRTRLQILGFLVLASLASAREEKAGLQVVVESGKVVSLTDKNWSKLPRRKVEDGTGAVYEGVALVEVLKLAGLSFEKHPRGRTASYLLVEGKDGYQALLALAEVDPKLTDKVVLLADKHDGKALPEKAGPFRLVVPGDKLPSRWVKQVKRISVHRPTERK